MANFIADTVCLNQPTQFTDISTPNSAGIIAYSWDFGDGSPFSNLKNPVHTYASYGIRNVTLTVTNSNGCIEDTTSQVVVRSLPLAEFTNSNLNCIGSAVRFTDQSSVVPGDMASIIKWVWDFGDGTPHDTILLPANPNVTHVFAGTASTYSVRLTVTISDGCSGFIEHTVSLLTSPSASFEYPVNNCVLQPVQFTDNSQTNGASNITQWLWNFGDPLSGINNTSVLQNPVHTFNTSGTYTVTEIIFNGSGCSDTAVRSVVVSPLSLANFAADTACLGSPTIFSNQSSTTGGMITQYLWEFGDGTTSNLFNPVHSYLASGSYQVELTVTTLTGCSNSVTRTILVLPKPVAAFSSSSPTCLGTTVQFTDNSYAMYGSIHSWTWDFGDGTISIIYNPASPNISHLFINSGIHYVTLTIATTNGCISTVMNPVVIQPAPIANYTFSAIHCELSPVQFTDMSQSNGGAPVTNWLWNFDDPGSGINNSSVLPNPLHSFSADGNYNVKLAITSENGCIDSIIKPVSINKKPIAQFSSDTACAHSITQFIDHSIPNATSIISWHWNFGDPMSGTNNISSLRNPSHIYSYSGNFLVRFTVINSNLCEKDTVMSLPIPPSPVASFTFNPSCVKTPTQFTDQSTAPNSHLVSWFWNFGDGIGTSNIQNPSYTYTTAGTYNVKLRVTNINGCADSIMIPVVSDPLPLAEFSYNSLYCPAGQVNFNNQSHGEGSGIIAYLWIFKAGSTSTLPDPTFIFPVTDTSYFVSLIVTDDRGCKDTITKSVFVKPAFSFTFSDDTVCFGNPTQFHAHNNTRGDSLYSLEWNFGDPSSGAENTSSLYNPKHVFSSPGTFVVRLKAWDSDNCVDSVHKTTLVYSLPKPDYSFKTPACDSAYRFTDLSEPGIGFISSWTWDFKDGSPEQIIIPPASGSTTHVFALPGTYLVNLKVDNSFGCSDTISRFVTKLSCISVAFAQNLSAVCSNLPVIFTDNSQPVNKIKVWHWKFGDGIDTVYTNYALKIEHTYKSQGLYKIQLIIVADISGNLVTDTARGQVTISQSPESQFSADPVCLNKLSLFKNLTNSFGVGISSWKWSFGDPSSGYNNFSAIPDPSHKYNRAGEYDVRLLVTNIVGCKDSLTKLTRVFEIPDARFINSLACNNSPTYFFDHSLVIDTTIEKWHWNFGVPDMSKDTSMLRNPVYIYKKVGNYDVRLIVRDHNECYDTIDSAITVHPSPLSAFIIDDSISGIAGKIQLMNKSEGADNYFWNFGNGLTSTEENPVVTFKEDGSYTIILVASNSFGCVDSTFYNYEMLFKGLFVPNAFAPESNIQGVNVFKPVGINLKTYKVEVVDPWGQVIWESSLLDNEGKPVEGWNGRNAKGELYQSGTYVWKINAVFIDGTTWEGSDIGKGGSKTIGTVTLIR